MKKSKFLTCLSAAFITAFALMSCNNVVQGKGHVVLSIDGEEYTAEQLFDDQKSPEAAEAKFNGVYKALIRNYFEHTDEGKALKTEVDRETEIKISSKKAEAKSNAKKNGTSYDTEWDKILSDNGCDSTDELKDKFEYDIQKQKFDDKLYDHKFKEDGVEKTNYDVLREGGFFDGQKLDDKYRIKGYLKNRFPYHIKHILVKLSNAGKDPVTATITEDEAIKISEIVKRLANGEKFEEVAKLSDDGSGKDAGGSVGIMSKQTSFVHEMQFGTYLYDAFYNDTTSGITNTNGDDNDVYFPGWNQAKRFENSASKIIFNVSQNPGESEMKTVAENSATDYALRLTAYKDPTSRQAADKEVEAGTSSKWDTDTFSGIGQIPYGAAVALGRSTEGYKIDTTEYPVVGDIDYDDQKDPKPDETNKRKFFEEAGVTEAVADKYLPRNVIFNKYFNKHNIMVITPNSLPMLNMNFTGNDGVYGESGYVNQNGTTEEEGYGSDRTKKHDIYEGNYDGNFAKLKGFSYNTEATEVDGLAKNHEKLSDSKTYTVGSESYTSRDIKIFTSDSTENEMKNENKSVLRDSEGRTILVIRAGTGSNSSNDDSGYEGIHFFVLERSPFVDTEFDKGMPKNDNKKYTSLNEYYTQYYPNSVDHNHPYYDDDEKAPKKTFAHYLGGAKESEEKARADLVKKELTNTASTANTNPNLNIYTYKYLEHQKGVNFKDGEGKKIQTSIDEWIDTKLDKRAEEKKWNQDWKEYYDELQYQQFIRNENEIGDQTSGFKVSSQLISEACAVAFAKAGVTSTEEEWVAQKTALKKLFDKGGIFHENK